MIVCREPKVTENEFWRLGELWAGRGATFSVVCVLMQGSSLARESSIYCGARQPFSEFSGLHGTIKLNTKLSHKETSHGRFAQSITTLITL